MKKLNRWDQKETVRGTKKVSRDNDEGGTLKQTPTMLRIQGIQDAYDRRLEVGRKREGVTIAQYQKI